MGWKDQVAVKGLEKQQHVQHCAETEAHQNIQAERGPASASIPGNNQQ